MDAKKLFADAVSKLDLGRLNRNKEKFSQAKKDVMAFFDEALNGGYIDSYEIMPVKGVSDTLGCRIAIRGSLSDQRYAFRKRRTDHDMSLYLSVGEDGKIKTSLSIVGRLRCMSTVLADQSFKNNLGETEGMEYFGRFASALVASVSEYEFSLLELQKKGRSPSTPNQG